jgi:hypothetical protein
MKRKLIISVFILLLVLPLAVTGCGGETEEVVSFQRLDGSTGTMVMIDGLWQEVDRGEPGQQRMYLCDDGEIRIQTCGEDGIWGEPNCSTPPGNPSYTLKDGDFIIPWGEYQGNVAGVRMRIWISFPITAEGVFAIGSNGGATLVELK